MTDSPSSRAISAPQRMWTADIFAAVLLLMVALPLNLGVAIASGVPAEYGIISATLGAFITGALSGCPLQISGPDAGIGVLVLGILQNLGIDSLAPLVFLSGVLQLLIAFLRWGKWFRAVSPAVINGMLAGMGLLIVLTQFHIMLDDTPKDTGVLNLILIPEAIGKGLFPAQDSSHQLAALIGLTTVAVACGWQRLAPKKLAFVPSALPAIFIACLLANGFALPVQYVSVPSNLTGSFKMLTPASLATAVCNVDLLIAAAALAFVTSAQSVIAVSNIDKRTNRGRTSYDREIFTQGCANTACGIVGVLPVACVLVRSMANMQFGAKTRASGIIHASLMLSAVAFFSFSFEVLPLSALAAVLVVIGWRMVNDIIASVKGYERTDLIIFGATIAAIVATNLFTGVLIGFALATLEFLLVYVLSRTDFPVHAWSPAYVQAGRPVRRTPPLAQRAAALSEDSAARHGIAGAPSTPICDRSNITIQWRQNTMDEDNIPPPSTSMPAVISSPTRILIPIKNASYAEAAMRGLAQTRAFEQCEYLILSVVPPVFEGTIPHSAFQANYELDLHEQQLHETKQLVERTRHRIATQFPSAKVHAVVEIGDACTQIAQTAKQWRANTILLASKRRPSIWNFIFPSLSQKLLRICKESITLVVVSQRDGNRANLSVPSSQSHAEMSPL